MSEYSNTNGWRWTSVFKLFLKIKLITYIRSLHGSMIRPMVTRGNSRELEGSSPVQYCENKVQKNRQRHD